VSLGHTDATAAEFAAGRAAGAGYVTHLFNAMRPFGHRDPGPIGAALADTDVVVGLICDGIHVDPVAVQMAWRALGPRRLNLVTDAVAALGADGVAAVGSVGVTVDATGVRNAAGVLAGSVLRLDVALRNLVAFTGCTVPDALATVTSTPATVLRLADRGRFEPGARADVAVLDDGLGRRDRRRWGGRVEVVIVPTRRRGAPWSPVSSDRAAATRRRCSASGHRQLAAGDVPCSSTPRAGGLVRHRQRRSARRVRRAAAGPPAGVPHVHPRHLTDLVDLDPRRFTAPTVGPRLPGVRRYEALLLWSSAASTCSCSASGPTGTSCSTSPRRHSARAHGSRR
jgi:hypothetical protein